MPETWMTADLHLGHDKVAQLRGFDSAADHDRVVMGHLAKRLRPGDRLFVLGDLALGTGRQTGVEWLARIVEHAGARAHIVLGNHDRAHPIHRNAHGHLDAWNRLFATVSTVASIRHRGGELLLSHFPYDGEGQTRLDEPDRADQFRLRDLGTPLVHGHVHDEVRCRASARGTVMFHAGLDAWGLRPVRLAELTSSAEMHPAIA